LTIADIGNNNTKKAICEIDENNNVKECWISIKNCAEKLNLTISGISKVLNGRSHKTNEHKFIYKD